MQPPATLEAAQCRFVTMALKNRHVVSHNATFDSRNGIHTTDFPPQSPLKGGGGCGRANSIHRTRAVLSRQVGRDQFGAMPGPLVRLGGGVGLNRPRESTSGVEIDLGPCAWWPCCRSLDLRGTFASEPPPTPDLGTVPGTAPPPRCDQIASDRHTRPRLRVLWTSETESTTLICPGRPFRRV